MQFEVIRKSYKKEITIGITVFILIAIVLIVRASFAKYQTTKNVTIAEGTVNYTMSDFQVVAIKTSEDGSTYQDVNEVPKSGYNLNPEKSICNITTSDKEIIDTSITISYHDGVIGFDNVSTKNTKCYLYFDKIKNAKDTILSNVTVNEGTPNFASVATTDEGVYKATDGMYGGTSYYWRGAVTNNYVKFANKFWRIIRINGDGTIRMIYDGESARLNGLTFDAETSAFNINRNNNMYVGFKYTSGQVHGTGTDSTILGQLNTWYTNNLASYASKIDENAGFCGDRTPSSKWQEMDNLGGTGTTETFYGGYIRVIANKAPSLTCPTEDFYTVSGANKGNKVLTYPIGLITADELSMAGGLNGGVNRNYYLYTSQRYWALSPWSFSGSYATVLIVDSDGMLSASRVDYTYGMRPVINLKADVTLTGTGTTSDPYVIE